MVMLTAKDLSRRWGISLPTIYKLFSSGELPGLRISAKNIRFREPDIIEYENRAWNRSQSTPSGDTEGSSAYTGETTEDDPSVALLVRQMGKVLNEDLQSTSGQPTFGGAPIVTR